MFERRQIFSIFKRRRLDVDWNVFSTLAERNMIKNLIKIAMLTTELQISE